MTTCLLVLFGICNVRPARAQWVLNVSATAAGIVDTWSTQRLANPVVIEKDPITRPFQTHGAALAYTSTIGGEIGAAWIAHRFKHSPHRVLRKIWWAPQTLAFAADVYGIANNLERHK